MQSGFSFFPYFFSLIVCFCFCFLPLFFFWIVEQKLCRQKTVKWSELKYVCFFSSLSVYYSSRTVDRLWSITEDLNILYKENWTRLAAQEVQLFQVINNNRNWIFFWFIFILFFCCWFSLHPFYRVQSNNPKAGIWLNMFSHFKEFGFLRRWFYFLFQLKTSDGSHSNQFKFVNCVNFKLPRFGANLFIGVFHLFFNHHQQQQQMANGNTFQTSIKKIYNQSVFCFTLKAEMKFD